MNIETVKLPVTDVRLGMHVVKLDRPWLETPFKLQGFRVSSKKELLQLEKYCKFVYVDIDKGIAPPKGKGLRVTLTEGGEIIESDGFIETSSSVSHKKPKFVSKEAERTTLPPPAVEYEIETSFEEELPAAREASANVKQAVKQFMYQLKHSSSGDIAPVRICASALEASCLRNPDPLMLLRALRSEETFSFRHSVHAAILGIAICRALGFRRQAIHELTMGVLLSDLGKMRLPKELLQTPRRLTSSETEIIKLHVRYGVDMATEIGGLTRTTIDIIKAHHERFNGSGYPAGLKGGEISLPARIAGLVDSFDAITSERAYSDPIPIYEAMQELYAATVDLFQRDLIETLIQVLGTYPVGTIVALSDGTTAVVVALNRHRRLLPKVIRLLDKDGNIAGANEIVDLADDTGPAISVRDALDPETAGVPVPTAAILDS